METETLLGAVVFGVVGGFLLVTGIPTLRRWYRVRAREPASIREAITRDGPVEIEGTVRPHESTAESPLFGLDCVAYEYEIERKRARSGNRSSSSWRTIEEGADRNPFLVEDETGTAYVDPEGATLSLDDQRTRKTNAAGDPVPDDSSWNLSMGVNLPGMGQFGVGNKRYTERRLEVDDVGYVYGRAERPSAEVDADVALVDGEGSFLISDASEAETRRRLLLKGAGYAAAGIGAAAIAVWLLVDATM